jgi:hypothetical protein
MLAPAAIACLMESRSYRVKGVASVVLTEINTQKLKSFDIQEPVVEPTSGPLPDEDIFRDEWLDVAYEFNYDYSYTPKSWDYPGDSGYYFYNVRVTDAFSTETGNKVRLTDAQRAELVDHFSDVYHAGGHFQREVDHVVSQDLAQNEP